MAAVVKWMPTPGWGQQLGMISVALTELPPGLVLNYVNVFRQADGSISFGPPLVPIGEFAGRRAGFEFPDAEDRQRFQETLRAALRTAHPELFEAES